MSPDKNGAKAPAQRTPSRESKKKAPTPPKKGGKKRSARNTVVRRKAYWGVFNDLVRQVAIFEYQDRAEAEKTAREWTKKKRGSYFVRIVKQPVE